ncbi:MAG TPA: TIGR04282 family arsenosugar biosynthesis glycosyltransferase [Burkholderiales bacterium]|nr:TIGR04282 family arsenosugar biosynthesis glycosyltransferase [Burkholderiales bacterium]
MSLTSPLDVVLVFAKAPHPGRVKTRLVPLLGAEGSSAFHAQLIEHTLATAHRADHSTLELHADPADDEFIRACADRYAIKLVQQQGGDLGARMQNALHAALHHGAYDTAVLIGTDCPALAPSHLRLASNALRDGDDAVFVPTEDGGYALIGLRRCDPRLFEDIAWGGADVMWQTRERLNALGWRWSELQKLWDIDRPPDYERLLANGMLERIESGTGNSE